MTIRKGVIERLSVTSSKPFEAVVARLEATIEHPDMTMLLKTIEGARTYAEMEREVRKELGKMRLMLFMKFDLGAVLRNRPIPDVVLSPHAAFFASQFA